jgi:predicted amidohydrolase YtcJ
VTVLTGGAVHTGDPDRPSAEAVAIRDGAIVAVGSDDDVRDLTAPSSRVIELGGRTVVAGFQDAHVHPPHAGLAMLQCDLHDLEDLSAYLAAIATYARTNPARPWVIGDGWAMPAFPGGTPRREDLDAVVPDRPAFFVNRDGHGAWANSRALEVAGITRDTPDPEHGRIERDAAGEPTGTLHEGAMDLVPVPEPTQDQVQEAIRLAQARLHGFGITAWQDAWVTPQMLEAYRALAERGELTARVVASLWWEREQGLEQIERLVEERAGGSVGRLRATTVKIMQDGVCENFTAAMLSPYLDAGGGETTNRGISMVEPDLLNEAVTRLDALGFQVHVHAIGDRAVREALDAFEAAQGANGRNDARHHIAHIQVIDPDDIPRFASLGVVANAQPFWASHEPQMDDLTIPFLGPERTARQYPFASLLRAGATLAFGSDWAVSTPNPLLEMEVAVNRVAPDQRGTDPLLPGERLDLATAIAAFTEGSAFVNHLDHLTGTIEVGKAADLAVLDRDLFAPDAGPIGDARVLLTMVEGDAVFADPELSW